MCTACDSATADSPDSAADLTPADCIWVTAIFAVMLMIVTII